MNNSKTLFCYMECMGKRKYLRNKNIIDFDLVFLLTIDYYYQKALLTQLNFFQILNK